MAPDEKKDAPAAAATPATRKDRIWTGIAGADGAEVEVEVLATEPPPLALNEKLAVVGRSVPRIELITSTSTGNLPPEMACITAAARSKLPSASWYADSAVKTSRSASSEFSRFVFSDLIALI